MAVTFDAVGPSSTGAFGAAVTTLSWSHINGGNCLVVSVSLGQVTTSTYTTTVAYNGVAMTSLTRINSGTSGNGYVEMFYLLNPPVGTFNVVVTPSASADLICGSVSFNGVVALGQCVSNSLSSTTSVSAVVPTLSTTGMVVDGLAWGSGGAATATQTQRWMKNLNTGTAAGDGGQSTAASSGGGVTMSWSWAAADSGGLVAVELMDFAPAGIIVRGVGMAQAAVSTGTASVTTTPKLPGSTQPGDRVFIVTSNAPATTTPTTPTNWTLVDSQSLGTGTLGATAGPRRTTVWYRDYDGVWTMPSIVLPSVAAPAMLTQSITLGKDATLRWAAPVSTFGSDVTVTSTTYSATGGGTVAFSPGDVALVTYVGPGLATLTAETLTATGATFGTVTEQYDAASLAATNGIHAGIVTAPVTAGPATAAPVSTATVSTSGVSDGGSLFIQQGAVKRQSVPGMRARFLASSY